MSSLGFLNILFNGGGLARSSSELEQTLCGARQPRQRKCMEGEQRGDEQRTVNVNVNSQ